MIFSFIAQGLHRCTWASGIQHRLLKDERVEEKETKKTGTFLVPLWLRVHLEMQEMQARSLGKEQRSHVPRNGSAPAPQLLWSLHATT